MKLYNQEQVQNWKDHTYAYIEAHEKEHVLTIILDRPEKKNALHPQMVHELAFLMHYAHFTPAIWMIVIEAKGDIFCAGADLKAMAGIIEANNSTIPIPSEPVLIGELFNKVFKATIETVTGDVYAGGFFFLAGCNIVIAQNNVKFGLPEVKRGIYPMQVMAALLKVMPARKVIDWCIRGYNLEVNEAERYGLVTEVVAAADINLAVDNVIAELKQNSPSALRYGLEAYDHIQPSGDDHKYLHNMLQKAIMSKDGMEGLKAFREKRAPVWTGE